MDKEKALQSIDHFLLFGLCVLVLFLPIAHTETIRAFSFGIPLGLWLIKMILARRWLFSRTPLDLPILLFTAVAGLSVIVAVDPRYSLEEFFGEWITGILLFYLVANNLRADQMKYILGALLLGNLIMVPYGIYDFFRSGGQLFGYQVRAGSLHSGFGTFSTYLVTVIPYIVVGLFFVTRTSHRWLLLILLGLNFFSLYITHARGAWVAMGVLFLLAGWKFFSRRKILLAAVVVGGGILLLAPKEVFFHQAHISRPGAAQGTIETVDARWAITKFSLEKIAENPFRMLGFGRRSFVKKYKDFYEQYKGVLLWHAHNTFLDLIFQTGLQGLVIFCFFLYKILWYCYEKSRLEELPSARFYLSATFLMIITFFVRNLSDDFFVDDSALLFWFLSGAALALTKRSSEKKVYGRAIEAQYGNSFHHLSRR